MIRSTLLETCAHHLQVLFCNWVVMLTSDNVEQLQSLSTVNTQPCSQLYFTKCTITQIAVDIHATSAVRMCDLLRHDVLATFFHFV